VPTSAVGVSSNVRHHTKTLSPPVDKLYKPLFLKELKLLMATQLPSFTEHRVAKDHQMRDIFVGSQLFSSPVCPGKAAWLWWTLGAGVERSFNVLLGWSPGSQVLPHSGQHDPRVYSLSGPSNKLPAASLSLQQILGEPAIGGFTISTPWDQLLAVKATAPKREHNAAMQKAYSEALALSEEQRLKAVRAALGTVFASVLVIQPFISAMCEAESDA
jgi:hypothetical protein